MRESPLGALAESRGKRHGEPSGSYGRNLGKAEESHFPAPAWRESQPPKGRSRADAAAPAGTVSSSSRGKKPWSAAG